MQSVGALVSFWKSLVRADDANAMVRELVMHLGDVHFLHMTRDAILRIRRARFAGMVGSLLIGRL